MEVYSDEEDYLSPGGGDGRDSFEGPGGEMVGGLKRGPVKRANHNELERKRRQYQKTRLNELREVIPFLQLDKPSTVLIIQKAKEYIEELKTINSEQAQIIASFKRKAMTPVPTPMMNAPLGMMGGGGLPMQHQHPPMNLNHNDNNNNNNNTMNNNNPMNTRNNHGINTTTNMNTMNNASHAMNALVKSQSAEIEKLRRDNGELLGRLVHVEKRTHALLPSGVQTAHPRGLESISEREDVAYDSDPGLHLRKRRSVVDNDFEDMKKSFYERRDSHVIIMESLKAAAASRDEKYGDLYGVQTGKNDSIENLASSYLPNNNQFGFFSADHTSTF